MLLNLSYVICQIGGTYVVCGEGMRKCQHGAVLIRLPEEEHRESRQARGRCRDGRGMSAHCCADGWEGWGGHTSSPWQPHSLAFYQQRGIGKWEEEVKASCRV